MAIFLSILLCAVILAVVYLFVLIRPAAKRPHDTSLDTDYAHRGLHGEGVPENSLAAFEAAARAGYGIELDVQLSGDGEVMVFHDYTLVRMTGVEGKLSERTAAELSELRLGSTDERVPRFSEVLALVDGRVPLLVELKGENFDSALCDKVSEILKSYSGAYCIESFNPILLGKIAKLLPGTYRGILYTNVVRDKNRWSAINLALTLMATNIIARPDFVAYNEKDREMLPVRICTGLFGTKRFVWTVRTAESYREAKNRGELAIFEGFLPHKT